MISQSDDITLNMFEAGQNREGKDFCDLLTNGLFHAEKDLLADHCNPSDKSSCGLHHLDDIDKALFKRRLSLILDSQFCQNKVDKLYSTDPFFPNEHESQEQNTHFARNVNYLKDGSSRRFSHKTKKFASSFWKNDKACLRRSMPSARNLPSCQSLTMSADSLSSFRSRSQSFSRKNSLFSISDQLKSKKKRKEKRAGLRRVPTSISLERNTSHLQSCQPLKSSDSSRSFLSRSRSFSKKKSLFNLGDELKSKKKRKKDKRPSVRRVSTSISLRRSMPSAGNLPSCQSLIISTDSFRSFQSRPRENSVFIVDDGLKSKQKKNTRDKKDGFRRVSTSISCLSSLGSFKFSSDSLISFSTHRETYQRRNSLFVLADSLEIKGFTVPKSDMKKSKIKSNLTPPRFKSFNKKKRKMPFHSLNEYPMKNQFISNFALHDKKISTPSPIDCSPPLSKRSKQEYYGWLNTYSISCSDKRHENAVKLDPARKTRDLYYSMKSSEESQTQIHEWDKTMGLRRSHSKTMRNSMKSRKALLRALNNDIILLMKNKVMSHPCLMTSPLA